MHCRAFIYCQRSVMYVNPLNAACPNFQVPHILLVAELQNIFHWLYSWQSIRYSMLIFGLCKILEKRCLSHYLSINSCQSNKASLTTCGEPCLLQWVTCTKLKLQVNSLLLSKLQACCSLLERTPNNTESSLLELAYLNTF